ncbi:MAG: hypothetical protein V1893_04200 [Candidatus Omnitrophota bacterium]
MANSSSDARILQKLSIEPQEPVTKYRIAFSFMFILPLLISTYVGLNYLFHIEMPSMHVFGLLGLGIIMSLVGLYLSYNTSVREIMEKESEPVPGDKSEDKPSETIQEKS